MKKYKYKKYFSYEGKKYQVYGDTLMEVGEKKAKKLRELEEARKIQTGDIPFDKWASECIDLYKTNQPETTRAKFVDRVNRSIVQPLGHKPLKLITHADCQRIMNLQAGMSKTQINEVYYALRFLFRHAYRDHMIKEDPTEDLIKPKMRPQEHRRALTPEERKFFVQVGLEDRRFYLFMLMLFCGCRPSEASECMGKDIKHSERPILHIRGTKTALSDREVPIPDILYQKIKDPPYRDYR